MFKRIIFVDPSLKSQYSHNYRYAQSLHESFPEIEIEVYASTELGVDLPGISVKPYFDVDIYDEYAFVHDSSFPLDSKAMDPRAQFVADIMNSMGLKGDFWANLTVGAVRLVRSVAGIFARLCKYDRAEYETTNKIAEQLFICLNKAQLSETDLVLFPTAIGSLMESLMAVRCLKQNKAWSASASFIMHFDYQDYSNGYAAFSRRFYNKRVIENMPFKQVQVCTTNQPLADRLKQELSLDTVVIQDLVVDKYKKNPNQPTKSAKVRILIPGKYMWDKNFEIVPEYLKVLATIDCEVTLHASVLQHIHLDEALLNQLQVYEDVPGDNAWLEFLAGFDCLLLPYGDKYSYRISGILSEAKSLGVPTIVSSIAADSSRVSSEMVFDEASQIPQIVSSIRLGEIDNSKAYLKSPAKNLSEAIQDKSLFTSTKKKPICIQIKPGWPRCGSSLVFENQLEYLLHRDYFVVEVFVKNIVWNRTKDQVAEGYDVLMDNRRDIGGAVAHFVRPNPSVLNVLDWFTKARWLVRSKPIARYNYFMKSVGIPKVLSKLVEQDSVDLVVCNHVYHLGLAGRFKAKHVICETHDIQSRQYQIRGILPDEFAYNRSIEEELGILENSADLLVNISAYENYFFGHRVNKPSLLCKPYREIVIPSTDKKRDLKSYLKANVSEEFLPTALEALGEQKRMDMFFVGDGHHANIESFTWFIEEVLPSLPQSKLWLGGLISKHFSTIYPEHTQIVYLGYIKAVENVYDFVKVAVLPDKSGAGIPIKTVDVLCYGAPFVATSTALRGLDWSKHGFNPTDEAKDMANDIIELLQSLDAQHKRQNVAISMSKEFSRERFFNTWDQALDQLGIKH